MDTTTSKAGTPGTDRNGLDILTFRQSMQRIGAAHVGRLAFVADGDVHVYPVTHALVDDHIVFRSAMGTKFDAAMRTATCSFEVDHVDPVSRTGWSVLATGIADVVDDEAEQARYDAMDLLTWLPPDRPRYWVRIRIDEVSGRELRAARMLPAGTESAPTTASRLRRNRHDAEV